jgi:hypothetical protein
VSKRNGKEALLPELKSWIDGVIVPALLKEYLGELEREKMLATRAEPLVESRPTRMAIKEGR